MNLYLFDMGSKIYGDCILVVEGKRRILIDGAHPGDWQASETTASIPDQLAKVLGKPPFKIDLLVVTHCHSDHIGCLPRMVQDGTVEFEWALVADDKLGFPTDGEDAAVDSETAKVVAAMSEEPQPDLVGAALDAFLTDAVKLPENYKTMLAKLKRDGTTIVRYTGPSARVKQVEKEFSDFGLSVLGPTHQHLVVCRDQLAGVKKKVRNAVDSLRSADAGMDAAAIYRALLTDMVAASSRATDDLQASLDTAGPGATLNDQSIVLSLGAAGEKILLTGDMQLAKPEVAGLDAPMAALLEDIKAAGPYQFVKLPHHASYNGFDEEVLAAFEDAQAFGISTGRGDPKHPDSGVLKFLKSIADKYHWARTDRNGRIAVSFVDGKLVVNVLDGELDDASPNTDDTMPAGALVEPSPPLGPPASAPAPPPVSAAPRPPRVEPVSRRISSGDVEVTAKIPHQRTKVTITIEIEPHADLDDWSDRKKLLAGGRPLPPLAFVTNSRRLADNIGKTEAEEILTKIRAAGQLVVDLDGQGAPFSGDTRGCGPQSLRREGYRHRRRLRCRSIRASRYASGKPSRDHRCRFPERSGRLHRLERPDLRGPRRRSACGRAGFPDSRRTHRKADRRRARRLRRRLEARPLRTAKQRQALRGRHLCGAARIGNDADVGSGKVGGRRARCGGREAHLFHAARLR
jgi:beta-lactamase superfamily II metal-dependent hydrolase